MMTAATPYCIAPIFDQSSYIDLTAAANTEGSDKRKENRADVERDSPVRSPAVMVTPERDAPGIRHSA